MKLHHTNRLLDITNLFQLTQIISELTRVTASTRMLLDLFLTNKPENINNWGVLHLGIIVTTVSSMDAKSLIAFFKNAPKIVESRNFKIAHITKIVG